MILQAMTVAMINPNAGEATRPSGWRISFCFSRPWCCCFLPEGGPGPTIARRADGSGSARKHASPHSIFDPHLQLEKGCGPACTLMVMFSIGFSGRGNMGFHWKSSTAIGRFPLVHIAIGRNDQGEKETALGIFALGKRAIGVVAIGQFCFGVITIAQFGVGALGGLGQFILAPIALAQFAIAIFGLAEFALGVFVMGQISIGFMGLGAGWRLVDQDWLQWFGMDGRALGAFAKRHVQAFFYVLIGAFLALFVAPLLLSSLVRAIHELIFDLRVRLGLLQSEEAMAEILEIYGTGEYINKVPINELLIEYVTRSGQRIKTTLRMRHDRFNQQGPGAKMPIVYDPAKPERPFLPRD